MSYPEDKQWIQVFKVCQRKSYWNQRQIFGSVAFHRDYTRILFHLKWFSLGVFFKVMFVYSSLEVQQISSDETTQIFKINQF